MLGAAVVLLPEGRTSRDVPASAGALTGGGTFGAAARRDRDVVAVDVGGAAGGCRCCWTASPKWLLALSAVIAES